MTTGCRFLVDEDFDYDVVRGALRKMPELDVVRVQEVGLGGAKDPEVLEWAAREGRILLTHDVSTMTAHAYARIREGQSMPGIFAISSRLPSLWS